MKAIHNFINFRALRFVLLPALLALAGCGDGDQHDATVDAESRAEDSTENEHGPHNGILLRDGDFSLEITIFEAGRPPQYRVYPYFEDAPVNPADVDLDIRLGRLGGQMDRFTFSPEADYLAGVEVVAEPHSFDVSIRAEFSGRKYAWDYPSYEGRTTIAENVAREAGVTTAKAGPAVLVETVDVLGRVAFASGAEATIRARFPGQILDVMKTAGDPVRAGEVLARVESNQSLQVYAVISPIDGIVVERLTNPGDVAGERPLFVVGDLEQLQADFHVFSSDLGRIRPGQSVTASTIDGQIRTETKISTFLPTSETATQTIIARAPLPNPDLVWMPGMTVKGAVVVEEVKVPLAVRSEALQRFRDFTVVFAKFGDTYEVRMLELGRQTPEWAEVLGGIDVGRDYVVGNSFLIKADVEKFGASHDH